MESYLLDWANLLLRWAHVVTAIAWIGSSFYFVFLDSSLTPPQDEALRRDGVSGELWAVHGGGFYHPVKFALAPPKLPSHLHWFYWESYSTWLTGFALFTVSYLWNAGVYLVDKARMDWSAPTAVVVALAFLLGFWLLYDGICRCFGQGRNGDRTVGVLVALLVALASYLACQWFAPRAAFLLMGAMLATSMSANVFFWIIPGQKTMVADIGAGRAVDPIHGKRGKQRSVHNTYFTLPVLFAMLSNHYGFVYNHPQPWLVLVAMMAAGAAIRQFFVLRHGFKLGRNPHPWPYAGAALLLLLVLVVWMRPANAINSGAQSPMNTRADVAFSYASVVPVLERRCYACHGAGVQMKNVRLDSPQALAQNAHAVYTQVVVARAMPLNNATAITEEERGLVRRWFEAGASTAP